MTLEQALQQAIQHLQAGRLAEAEPLLRAIIQAAPAEPEPYRLLGLVAYLAGQPAAAETLLRQALTLHPRPPAEYFDNLGVALQAQSRSAEAETAYRQALALRPAFPEAENNLFLALRAQGKWSEAEATARRALGWKPDYAEAWNHLGVALQSLGRLDEAIAAYQRAVALKPELADAENNCGLALETLGRLDAAEAAYRRALARQPTLPEAHYNLGNVCRAQNRLVEAEAGYRQSLALKPTLAEAHNNLGQLLQEQGRLAEAEACYHQALLLGPHLAEAHNNHGNLLQALGRLDEAEATYRRALELKPTLAEAENNLCNTLRDKGRLSAAVAAGRRAIALRFDYAEAHNNLANALQAQGRLEEAAAAFQQALAQRPTLAVARSNALKCAQHQVGITRARLAELHAEWDRLHAAPLRETWQAHANTPDPDRRLRLGLVSADFGLHPVGFFLIRALEALDPQQCEVVCYSNRVGHDPMTDRLIAAVSLWREVRGVSDAALTEQIRADGIDLLIDLSGHTAGNRLLVLARKPAPVQLTWLGYVGTTGLKAIDYLIADRYHIPAGAEGDYAEQVLRLPDGYVCYDPPAEAPAVGPLPALTRGSATFGSFNNPMKLTPAVVALWARVLQEVGGARLLLQYLGLDDADTRQRFLDLFAAQGIDASRLELRGWTDRTQLLAQYNEIDVALDPFPYSGGLTTCESLWMGVPVVTCPGETFASRHSLSHMSNAGLTETIARDDADYVGKAAALVRDLPRLAALRAGLRERVAASPLCDGPRFATNLMATLREVWRRWCGEQR